MPRPDAKDVPFNCARNLFQFCNQHFYYFPVQTLSAYHSLVLASTLATLISSRFHLLPTFLLYPIPSQWVWCLDGRWFPLPPFPNRGVINDWWSEAPLRGVWCRWGYLQKAMQEVPPECNPRVQLSHVPIARYQNLPLSWRLLLTRFQFRDMYEVQAYIYKIFSHLVITHKNIRVRATKDMKQIGSEVCPDSSESYG